MSLFGALPIAASGAEAMQTWIDTSAGNLANMGDQAVVGSPVYREQTPFLSPIGPTAAQLAGGGPAAAGDGVAVTSIALGSSTGVVSYEPTSPLADAKGDVVLPNISLAGQLVGMIEAQESYQADTVVMARAKEAYTAGLAIGT